MIKKKCLIILPRPLFPIVSGYSKKNFNLVKILSNKYDLKVIVISEEELLSEEIEFYKNNCYSYKNCIFPKWRYYLNAALTLFTPKPLQVGYFYFTEVQNIVNLEAGECDVVIGCLLRTMKYLEFLPTNKVKVFEMVDSIDLIYKQAKTKTSSKLWKLIYSIESKRLGKYEKHYIKTSNITFLVNQEEYEILNPYGNVKWVPHGVDSELLNYNTKASGHEKYVAFIGKMNYQPNIEAVKWYLENVHSRIESGLGFWIIGADPTEEVYSVASKYKNVKITGFVEDPFMLLNSSIVIVAPMQTGGGIQNKVLEGMALGKINVISSLAAKPIVGAKNGEHFIIADSPGDYYKVIIDIYKDASKYEYIGVNAKEFISNNFTWKAFEKEYISAIEQIKLN